MPIGGDLDGPIFEGWTLLAALAAQTSRLRLGLMVTSNRFRPPAVLAKIATTVDVVSGGRLEFGIGAGSRPSVPIARREYVAHGLPYHHSAHAVGSLAEACTIIRRLWTEDVPFDFDGVYHDLQGAYGNPTPGQRPGPPIVIGGRSTATLRVVAEHADVWPKRSTPGSPTSSSGCRRPMPTASYSGWQRKSSAPTPRQTERTRNGADHHSADPPDSIRNRNTDEPGDLNRPTTTGRTSLGLSGLSHPCHT